MLEPPAGFQCSHDTLHAVDGLYGFYRCPACGFFFNLQLLNIISHSPQDLAAMAQRFTDALDNATDTGGLPPDQERDAGVYPPTVALDNAGDGDSNHGLSRHTGD